MITTKPLKFAVDDPRTLPPQAPLLFDVNTDDATPLKTGQIPFPTHNFMGENDHLLEANHNCPAAKKIIDTSNTANAVDVAKSDKF